MEECNYLSLLNRVEYNVIRTHGQDILFDLCKATYDFVDI